MDIHFNNLSFSIFDYASFDDIKGLVKELFKDDFCNSTTEFLPHPFSLDSFMPQHVGGDHDNLFGFWKSKRYHSKLFFISNSADGRSEEHTSELQSRQYLVCRLLLENKKHQ